MRAALIVALALLVLATPAAALAPSLYPIIFGAIPSTALRDRAHSPIVDRTHQYIKVR
jgi:hypothetical protein